MFNSADFQTRTFKQIFKTYILFGILFLINHHLFAQPSITSFAPVSGSVGSIVKIKGSNFSNTPSDNIVNFGGIRADVSSATATSLTVTVPAGATYQPISVTTNALTAFSERPFIVTFSGGGSIAPKSFSSKTEFQSGNFPTQISTSDLDGDGKCDFVAANYSDKTISIFKNTGVNGSISFAPKLDLMTKNTSGTVFLLDFNGDGKTDIVTASDRNKTVSIYKNTSTNGSITFDTGVSYPTGTYAVYVAGGDFDKDGKPDLVVSNNQENTVSVLRNTGTGGTISFAPKVDFATRTSPSGISIADIDNDGKVDIAVACQFSNSISILKNTSTTGNISFNSQISFEAGAEPYNVSAGDIDGDGKLDFAVANLRSGNISVLKNTSISNKISFDSTINYAIAESPQNISFSDLNGDGKLDLAIASSDVNVWVLENTSTNSVISFNPNVSYYAGGSSSFVSSADINNDGKPDLLLASYQSVLVYRNIINLPDILSFAPATGTTGTTITITGSHFTRANNVTFGDLAAASFTVKSDTVITAVVGAGATGNVNVITPAGNANSYGFTFILPPPNITSFTPKTGGLGDTIFIIGKNLKSVSKVTFGDTAASFFSVTSDTSITAVIGSGATGSVKVFTPSGTVTLDTFTYTGPTITSFTPTAGTAGTVISISGKNFTGTTSVTLGGTPASSFTINSPENITAIVGAASPGDLTVTTPHGTARIAGFIEPAIISFTPSQGFTGDTVEIYGKNLNGTISVSFGSERANSYTVISDTTVAAVVGFGHTGNVSVTTKYGVTSLPGFIFTHPSITFLTPVNGPVGTVVTIHGSNFSANPTGNIVRFGAAKATVSSATDTTLSVIVPSGATYKPVTVTTNNLTAYSAQAFIVTFTSGGILSFAKKADFSTGSYPRSLTISDLDGDGKTDIAVVNNNASSMSVFRNTSNQGGLSFQPKSDYSTGNLPFDLSSDDFDGDGKPDIVVVSYTEDKVSIFKNTSVNGSISFDKKVDSLTGSDPLRLATGDLNADGRPDIAVINDKSNTVSVYINTSTGGVISFATKKDFPTGNNPNGIAIGDLNADGMPDIAVTNYDDNTVSILKNLSSSGTVSFAPKVDFATGINPFYIAIADLNGDRKPDLTIANSNSNTVSIFGNNTTNQEMLFLSKIDIPTGNIPLSVAVGDIDGDGKPDLAVTNFGDSTISLILNKDTANGFSFIPIKTYRTGLSPRSVSIGDIDGDGKPDLALQNSNSNTFSIFRNQAGEAKIIASGSNPVKGEIINRLTIDSSIQTYKSTPYVQRHYDIEPINNASSATATITLYFSQEDFNNFNAYRGTVDDLPTSPTDSAGKANIRIYQYHGFSTAGLPGSYSGSTVEINPADTLITWNPVTRLWEVAFDVTGFSGFFLSSAGNTILPLELLSFTGNVQGKNALLQWVTSNEIKTKQFELERSNDGVEFTVVSKINVSENSNRNIKYQYTDELGTSPVYYYRLKVMGLDGSFTFSNIIKVIPATLNATLTVYPNPAHEYVIVKHPESDNSSQIKVFDMTGRVIKITRVAKNVSQTMINVKNFVSGSYKIIWSDGATMKTNTILLQ